MGRDTVQLETTVTTISQEYLLEFTSEYGISEALHPELPGPEDRIMDFPEGMVGVYIKFFEIANFRLPLSQFLFDILGYYQIHLSQLSVIGTTKGVLDYCGLAYKCSKGRDASREYVFPRGCDDTEHPSYPNSETTRRITLLSRVELQTLPGRRDMDLFSLIRAPNPTKVKTGQAKMVAATGPPVVKERCKRGHDGVDTNAPLKVLRRDHVDPRPTESTHGGKFLAAIELGMGSTLLVPASEGAPMDVSDPDPLSFADPQSRPSVDVTQSSKGATAAGDPESENTSITSMVGSPESIYTPKWGITNGCLLDAPEACQDLVDHIALPGYFLELRHLHNDDFLKQYNVNLARQVATGSQLWLRFEQEAKLLKKSVAQVARQDKRIQARENEIKNLETPLEAETNMKKAAENKSAELNKELENMRALFLDLQVSNNRLSQQVSTLQEQVMGEEKLKAAFEEFKQYENNRVEQRCRMWVIERGLRLAVMKCGESTELRQAFADVVSAGIAKGMSEGLKHGVEHEKTKLDLEAIEEYDPKDAPMDVIMASLHLESDTGDDDPQWIHELHPSSFQLTIPVYPEAHDPLDPWACKEKILLEDAIAANVSRAKRRKSVELYAVRTGSAPRITPGPMAFRYSCQPLLLKFALVVSCVLRGSLCAHSQRLGRMSLRTQSPRPLGLQPVYAAGRL
nr:transposase (putative), gypsy type [Tanacetum cinerariifolium]